MIGTGYVGLVTAAGFAELGNEVWCIDIDAEKIAGLRRGRMPIYEPGLEELVARHRDRLHFSTDLGDALEHARLLFVAVGTPPTYSGDADLSAVHAVVDAMPASDRHALVMKSTVPVGTGASIKRVFAERGKGGFRYVSCPEFLKEGSARGGLPRARPRRRRRRRRLGGRRRGRALRAARRAARAHRHRAAPRWSSSPPTPSSPRRSPSSTRSPTCARRPAPTSSRSRAGWASTTASARSSCRPGIGFGGSCFPKDVTALKQLAGNSGYHFQLLNAVIEVNELQKRRVIGKLQKHLGDLVGKEIALLGLAFKPDTDDMREASSLVLSARLQADGATRARVRPGRRGGGAQADARARVLPLGGRGGATGADAVVLVTEWPEFGELDLAGVATGDARRRCWSTGATSSIRPRSARPG